MNCRDTAREWTSLEEGSLGFWARLKLRFHLLICPYCKVFNRQMRQTIEGVKDLPAEPVPDETKAELLRRFRERPKPS